MFESVMFVAVAVNCLSGLTNGPQEWETVSMRKRERERGREGMRVEDERMTSTFRIFNFSKSAPKVN